MSRLIKIKVILIAITITVVFTGMGLESASAGKQIITLSASSSNPEPGTEFSVMVSYDVNDGNFMLSGLDISIHFDSGVLSFEGYSNFLAAGDQKKSPTLLPDAKNEDNDSTTDKRINMSWVSFSRQWPNQTLPLVLAELYFSVKEDTEGTTAINSSVYDHDARYQSSAESIILNIGADSIDSDTDEKGIDEDKEDIGEDTDEEKVEDTKIEESTDTETSETTVGDQEASDDVTVTTIPDDTSGDSPEGVEEKSSETAESSDS